MKINIEKIEKPIHNKFREDDKITNAKKKCKCGHTQLVYKNNQRDYGICSWCGRRIYTDAKKQLEYNNKRSKDEFMSKFKKYLSYDNGGLLKYDL